MLIEIIVSNKFIKMLEFPYKIFVIIYGKGIIISYACELIIVLEIPLVTFC